MEIATQNDMQNTATATPANFRYRDDHGKMITKDVAIEKRWAHKEDGSPTKIYLHRLAVRDAVKNGLPVPIRPKKRYEAGADNHNGIASPFSLERRSGYGVIWQVLAENVGQIVTTEVLTAEVNKRLAAQATEWYNGRYSVENPYDVKANAYVMTRSPYNAKIEAMAQRVTQDGDGFKLSINVTEPRVMHKRGRKPKAIVEIVAPAAESSVTPDTETPVVVQEADVATVA